MSMDKNTVRKVATLARLEVPDSDLDRVAGQLGGILDWIEQLQAVNTDGVEPLASVVDIALKMRPDVVNDGGDPEKVLANAPETIEGFYVVPKVVE
jgi:aspartyl-tRNA(Asn)/glutamyl-tRNA(Gln) amidotransferase subunit C